MTHTAFLRRSITIVLQCLSTGALCGAFAFSTQEANASINLVENGSFEDPIGLVNSDYLHTPLGNTDESTYWITPHDPGAPWGPARSGTNLGRMNANGDDSNQATTNRVWWQSVDLVAGVTYEFSAWAWATHAGGDGYQLRFAFDDVQIGSTMAASQAGLWESFNALYLATLTGPVEISIVNVSGQTFPNDFMLDDIALMVTDPGAVPEASSYLCWGGLILCVGVCYWRREGKRAHVSAAANAFLRQ